MVVHSERPRTGAINGDPYITSKHPPDISSTRTIPPPFLHSVGHFPYHHRPALWLLLTRLGIPDKIVRLFRVLYDNSVSCVRTGGTHSSWFKIEAGVRQGCVLAPDSFATGMDWLLNRTVESCLIGVAFG